jgi:Arc/MetJ family transcription regulator
MSFTKVEIEVDQTLVDEVIRRYHLRSVREAVNLALRVLVNGTGSEYSPADEPRDEEEDDPFDLGALNPQRSRNSG